MTIVQQFVDENKVYLAYDFQARKARRSELMNRYVARENLLLMKKVLDSYDVEFFLLFGTVLGAMREKDFIVHDTDTDIGIFEKERAKFLSAIPELLKCDFELIRTKEPDDLVTFMRDDEYIDIGIFRLEKHGFKEYYTYQGNLVDRYFLDTLQSIEFLEEQFLVPCDTQIYLKKNYGKDWKIPQKDEPAMNLGYRNNWYRFKRILLRTTLGKKVKRVVKKMLGIA